jgi:ABC-type Mn2+/Zn2+ transport system ATPase subunit
MPFDFLDKRPIVIALAGSNGAGKSTFYESHLADAKAALGTLSLSTGTHFWMRAISTRAGSETTVSVQRTNTNKITVKNVTQFGNTPPIAGLDVDLTAP